MVRSFVSKTVSSLAFPVDNPNFRVRFRRAGATFPEESQPDAYVNAIVPRLCDCTACLAAPSN